MHRLFVLLAAASPIFLGAQPKTPQVIAGDALFQQVNDACLQVTTSEKAIIHWDHFSIQPGEITRFIQPHAGAVVLNRVVAGNSSSLLGVLEGNGKVYLLNPAGILTQVHQPS